MGKRNRHNKKLIRDLNQLVQPKEFQIKSLKSNIDCEQFSILKNFLISISEVKPEQEHKTEPNTQLIELMKLLPDLATGIWRTRQKMISPGTDEPKNELRRVFRPLDAAFQDMKQAGVEIIDRTNQPYVTGLIETVIAFEPKAGINREIVLETIKPTIYYRLNLLQKGEIIVGTPEISESSVKTTI